jgi:DNA polymerase V
MDATFLENTSSDRPRSEVEIVRLPSVSAGFPSVADDFVEARIDLSAMLVPHPLTTFYVRVEGHSMMGAGINPGAILVVDRGVEALSGDIVVARVNNGMCVKQLERSEDQVRLLSKNPAFQPIEITPEIDFEVWGRVIYCITKY